MDQQIILNDFDVDSIPSPPFGGMGTSSSTTSSSTSSTKPARKRPRRLTKKKEEQRNKRVQEATNCLNQIIKFSLQKINSSAELSAVDYELSPEEQNHPDDLEDKCYFKKNKVEGYLYSGHQFTEGLREWALKVDTGNFPFTVNLVREVRSCWKTPTSSPKRTCSCTREVGMTRTTWSLRVLSQESSFFWSALTDYTLYQYTILKDTERKELTTFKGTDILQQYMRLHPTLYSHLYAFFTMKQQSSWIPQSVPQLPSSRSLPYDSTPQQPHPQLHHLPPPQQPHPYQHAHVHAHAHTHAQPYQPYNSPYHSPHPQSFPSAPPTGMGMGGGMGGQSDVLTKILQPLPMMFSSMPNLEQVLEDQKFTLMLIYKYYLKLADTDDPVQAIEGLLQKISYPAFVKGHVESLVTRRPPPLAPNDFYCWVAANELFLHFVSGLGKKSPLPRSSVIGKQAHSPEIGLDKKSADQYAQTDIDCCKGPGYIHTTALKEGLFLHKIATPDKRLIFGIIAPNPHGAPQPMSVYVSSPSPSPMASSPASSSVTVDEEQDHLGFGTQIESDEFNLLLDTMIQP